MPGRPDQVRCQPRSGRGGGDSAKASLDLAKANVANADAMLRHDELLLKTAPAALVPSQYDIDKAADGVAKAQVGVAEASIKQAEANLKSVQTDLDYCLITSPVKGVIVDRRVNVGQTVVSALTLQPLFDWPRTSSRKSRSGPRSTRRTSAASTRARGPPSPSILSPTRSFVGKVSQIRLNATMTQNVVTYTVVVTTENKDMRLMPYMTANVNFEIEQHEDVLKVPNAALRWKPRPQQIAPDVRRRSAGRHMNRKGDKSKSKGANADKDAEDQGAANGAAEKDKSPARRSRPAPPRTRSPRSRPCPGAPPRARSRKTIRPVRKRTPSWARRRRAGPQGSSVRAGLPAPSKSAARSGDRAKPEKPAADHGPPGTPVSAKALAAKKGTYESGYLWTVDGNYVRPIRVKIIATDGTMTEVREAGGKSRRRNCKRTWKSSLARTSPARAMTRPIPSCPSCSVAAVEEEGAPTSRSKSA